MKNLLTSLDQFANSLQPLHYLAVIFFLLLIVIAMFVVCSILKQKVEKAEYMVKVIEKVNKGSEAGAKRLVEQIDKLNKKNEELLSKLQVRDPTTGKFVKRQNNT